MAVVRQIPLGISNGKVPKQPVAAASVRRALGFGNRSLGQIQIDGLLGR
jgi:hypothetical protein